MSKLELKDIKHVADKVSSSPTSAVPPPLTSSTASKSSSEAEAEAEAATASPNGTQDKESKSSIMNKIRKFFYY